MAKKQSGLLSKLGSTGRKAFDAHKADSTNYGQVDLPEGIENGVAKVVDCKFDTYKKGDMEGEFFFYARAVVCVPKEHNGVTIEGLSTQIGPEPLCETPNRSRKTVADHLAWVLNELRKLGVETDGLDYDQLEGVAEAVKGSGVHTRFRTWKGDPTPQYPNPRTNHQWGGAVPFEEEADDDIQDDTADEVETSEPETEPEMSLREWAAKADEGDDEAATKVDDAATAAGIDGEAYATWQEVVDAIEGGEAETEAETEEAEDEDISLQDLGDLADEADEDAMQKLTSLAEEYGLDPDSYDTWAALSEALVTSRTQAEGEAATPEDSDWVPEVDEVYLYQPPRAKKAVECEVTAVNRAGQTVNLKNLDDGKTYSKVKWEALSQG